ncbi:MAG: sulfatase-like hydrolase/transferase, partial [Planctomycetes bacterium]|nr:sulfatase-like hydrolase/transferase [Planctomycetota bacterium]
MLNIFKRVALCTCFVLAAGFFPAFAQSTQAHTNVVLIFADDLGTLDLNCYGSKDLHTPHLDAL